MNKLIGLLLAMTAALSGCASPSSTQRTNMNIYIVHGYGASPSDHWFSWLKKEMEKWLSSFEHIWDEVREKHFHNRVFESLNALEEHLVDALSDWNWTDPEFVQSWLGRGS